MYRHTILRLCICSIVLFHFSIAFGQVRTITGTTVDQQSGQPLPAVSILIKNTQSGTVSDEYGKFSIEAKSGDTLTFNFIGYQPVLLAVSGTTNWTVSMQPEAKMLSEVVVMAYGESSQRNQSGSVSKVSSKKLKEIPMASVDQILQGQVAGLQVNTYSGQPGGEINIHLRGVGSITAGSTPLFVVDGIPINSGVVGFGYNITWTSNGLAGINPNDIESVSVLKDAAATAIYGSRAANGVIIISTKKGKAGKTKFELNSDYGFNTLAFNSNVRPLTADEFIYLTIIGMNNAGFGEVKQENILEDLHAYDGVNTNWLDEVTQNGMQNSTNFSVRGGDEKTKFYTSFGYFNQEGNTIDSKFNRLSGSLNMEHAASSRLKFKTNILLSRSHQNTPYGSGYFRAPIISGYLLVPTYSPYDTTGGFNLNNNELATFNPLAIASMDTNYYNNKKIIGGFGADYEIIKGLTLSTQLSLDQNYTDEFQYANPFYGDGVALDGWASSAYTDITNWVWTNLAKYNRMLMSNRLAMDITLGHEAQSSKQNTIYAFGQSLPPNLDIMVLSAAATPGDVFSNIYEYTFESFFANTQFKYNDKYLLSVSVRRDGSSRFGINNRYGIFYSVGGSWNIDQEDFFKGGGMVSALRLRASYGVNGNSDIGNYDAQANYLYTGSYNGVPSSAPVSTGNYDLTWEKNKPFNVGIDASFFKDRFDLKADYYTRTTTDLLLNVPVSQTSGFSTQLQNLGAMINKGIEIELGADILRHRSVSWHIEANFSTNKNEITELYNHQQFISGYNNVYTAALYLYREGESYGTFYIPLYAGVDAQTGDAMWYTDSTMTETTTDVAEAKNAIAGNAQPKFFGGLNNSVSWKGITLSAQINYVTGNQIYDIWGGFFQSDGANPQYNQYNTLLDSWQQPGDETDVPKYVYYNKSGSNSTSTRFLYDGDYVRLRDVTLSYDIPANLATKLRMNSIRVYVRGTNLYTWTKDKDLPFDPDVSYGYGDLNLPVMKSMIGGITLGF